MIQTPRLTLRPLRPRDADALCAYRNDPRIAAYQGWTLPYPREEAQKLIGAMEGRALGDPGGWVQHGVFLGDGADLIGDVALRVHGGQGEVGITLAAAAHGRGYALEAAEGLLAHAFDRLGLHRLHAAIDPRNVAVTALLSRLGFRHEGTLVQAYPHGGEWLDESLYGLLGHEWRARHAERARATTSP